MDNSKIFLVGFMGSGKSTLGKKLADTLGLKFIDLDEFIEKEEGISIAAVFKTKGEEYFRIIENEALKKVINTSSKFVLALGGGTPCYYSSMELINKTGTSIYLKYNSSVLTKRLINQNANRPLIKDKNKSELKIFIENKLHEREQFYNLCKHVVESDNIELEDIKQLL